MNLFLDIVLGLWLAFWLAAGIFFWRFGRVGASRYPIETTREELHQRANDILYRRRPTWGA